MVPGGFITYMGEAQSLQLMKYHSVPKLLGIKIFIGYLTMA